MDTGWTQARGSFPPWAAGLFLSSSHTGIREAGGLEVCHLDWWEWISTAHPRQKARAGSQSGNYYYFYFYISIKMTPEAKRDNNRSMYKELEV